jgi:hypothetical protein
MLTQAYEISTIDEALGAQIRLAIRPHFRGVDRSDVIGCAGNPKIRFTATSGRPAAIAENAHRGHAR